MPAPAEAVRIEDTQRMTEQARHLLQPMPELKQVFTQIGSVPNLGDPVQRLPDLRRVVLSGMGRIEYTLAQPAHAGSRNRQRLRPICPACA